MSGSPGSRQGASEVVKYLARTEHETGALVSHLLCPTHCDPEHVTHLLELKGDANAFLPG